MLLARAIWAFFYFRSTCCDASKSKSFVVNKRGQRQVSDRTVNYSLSGAALSYVVDALPTHLASSLVAHVFSDPITRLSLCPDLLRS